MNRLRVTAWSAFGLALISCASVGRSTSTGDSEAERDDSAVGRDGARSSDGPFGDSPNGMPSGLVQIDSPSGHGEVVLAESKDILFEVVNRDIAEATNLSVGQLLSPWQLVGDTCGETLAPAASCRLTVRFVANNIGTYASTLALNFTMDGTSYGLTKPLQASAVEQVFTLRPQLEYVAVGMTVVFSTSGGRPPYSYAVAEGGGQITPDGTYTAPAEPGEVLVEARDAAGQSAARAFRVFDPADLTDLALWLRASDLVPGPVSRWADASGKAHDATQASSGRRPELRASAYGSHAGVFFDDDALGVGNLASVLTPATLFVVYYKRAAGGDTHQRLYSSGEGGKDGDVNGVYDRPDAARDYTAAVDRPMIAVKTYASARDLRAFRLGAINTAEHAQNYYGYLFEVLVYARALEAGERNRIIAYLAGKYGLGATRLGLLIPPAVGNGRCTRLELRTFDNRGLWAYTATPTEIELHGGSATLFSDERCTNVISRLSLPAGQRAHRLYYANASGEPSELYAREADDRLRASRPVTVAVDPSVSPANLSELGVWFAADTLNWLDDGQQVRRWANLGFSGSDALQRERGDRAEYRSSVFSAGQTVFFDGSDYLDLGSGLGNSEATIISVYRKKTTGGDSHQRLYSAGVGGQDYTIGGAYLIPNSADDGRYPTDHFVVDLRRYTNATDLRAFRLGALNNDANRGKYHGYLAELLIYRRNLAADESRGIDAYLHQKYGIAANRLALETVGAAAPNGCIRARLSAVNGLGTDAAPARAIGPVALPVTSFSDSGCSSPLSSVTLARGQRWREIFVRAPTESVVLSLSSSELDAPRSATLTVDADAPNAVGQPVLWLTSDAITRVPVGKRLPGPAYCPDAISCVIQKQSGWRPSLALNSGRPALLFDGADDALVVQKSMGIGTASIFVVYEKKQTGGDEYQRVYSSGSGGADTVVQGVHHVPNTSSNGRAATAGTVLHRADYTSERDLSNFHLGERNIGNNDFQGLLREIIIFKPVLSPANGDRVEAYLCRKYDACS
jgi:hypothetical protein